MTRACQVVTRTIRVPRSERSFLHWILEAHEGLVTLTEPEDADGELVLTVPLARAGELDALLADLARDLPLS